MKRITFLFFTLILNICLSGHPWKPANYIIIDTDGGIDDMKAINMLLASPDVRVLAVITSGGTLDAGMAYVKVKSLLNSLYHEGLPVGVNRNSPGEINNFEFAVKTEWGDENGVEQALAPDYIELINGIIANETGRFSFVCLGGLSTVSTAMEAIPAMAEQLKGIIWSCDGLTDKSGFNYNIDKSASEKVLKDNVPVIAVENFGTDRFFDANLLKELIAVNTAYSKKMIAFFGSETAKSHEYSFRGTDEMAALYIQYPQLFNSSSSGINLDIVPAEKENLRKAAVAMLAGETVEKNQVMKKIPNDPAFYFADIEPYVTQIIDKHGENEWVSGVLANELHRHLGVFAIIGVKMGIRAREYFNTGVDEFSVISYAGSTPPLSCMNDGLQVSTGATVGHGLITVRTDTTTIPSAEFTYMNRTIRLTLNREIAAIIAAELKEINFVYGLDSDMYWELVRKNSIKYWRDLDRHDIFEIEALN